MPDPARSHEERCAELIAKVRRGFRPDSVGMQFVEPGAYSAAELRVANESLERLGYRVRIAAGTITMHPTSGAFRASEARLMQLPGGQP